MNNGHGDKNMDMGSVHVHGATHQLQQLLNASFHAIAHVQAVHGGTDLSVLCQPTLKQQQQQQQTAAATTTAAKQSEKYAAATRNGLTKC